MPTPGDPRPFSQQIAATLRADIMAGDLAPGQKLPSNADLRATHEVTNATVQAALTILKDEGFVYGHAGKGVFVGPTPIHTITPSDYAEPAEPGEQSAWRTQATIRGEVGKAELLSVGEVPASAEVARAFGIERGSPVVRRYQLLTLDNEPAELVSLYFPTEWARGTALAHNRKIAGGTPSLLSGMGRKAVLFEDVLSARPATSEEYVRLDLPSEVPVLRTFRICLTAEGEVVQCEVLVKAGNRRNIRYRWRGESRAGVAAPK